MAMATAQKPKKKSKVSPADTEMEELVPSASDLGELFENSSSAGGLFILFTSNINYSSCKFLQTSKKILKQTGY